MGVFQGRAEGGEAGRVSCKVGDVIVENLFNGVIQPECSNKKLEIGE